MERALQNIDLILKSKTFPNLNPQEMSKEKRNNKHEFEFEDVEIIRKTSFKKYK